MLLPPLKANYFSLLRVYHLMVFVLLLMQGSLRAQMGVLSGWGMSICNVYSFSICPNQTITPLNYGSQFWVCNSSNMPDVSFTNMGSSWRVAKHNYTFTANTNGQVSGFDPNGSPVSFTFAANQVINPSSYMNVNSTNCLVFAINNVPNTFIMNVNTFSISIIPVTFSGNTYTLCSNTSTGITISPNVPASGGPWTYNWQPGNLVGNSVNVNPNISTIYTVSATSAGNCINTTTVAVVVANCCVPNATVIASTGCGASGATTTLSIPSVSGFTPAPTYTWSGPGAFNSNSQNISFLNNNIYGAYTVNISNGSCSFSTVVNTSPLSQFTPVITNTSVACYGTSTGNANTVVSGGIAPFTYTWSSSPTQNNSNATNLSAGNYTCLVTDALGCTYSGTTQILQPPPITLTIHSNSSVSCVNSPVLLQAMASGGVAPYTYTWAVGQNSSSYNTTEVFPGNYTYSLIIKDANGCSASASKSIFYSNSSLPLTVTSATACQGETVTLQAIGASNYTWSINGNVGNTCTFIANTSLNVFITGNSNGCTGTATAAVFVKPLPLVNIHSLVKQGCAPLNVNFRATANTSILTYDWRINNSSVNWNDSLFVNCFRQRGNYQVHLKVSALNGCVGESNLITIRVYPKPLADFNYSNPFTIEDPAVLFMDVSRDSIVSWFWDFGDGGTSTIQNPKHSYETTYTYNTYLMVQNMYGCKDTVHKFVEFEERPELYVPNSFTPNDDGLNDYFFAKGVGIKTFNMLVFDRWGKQIFTSDTISKSWDGTIKGVPAKQDSYIWKINYSSNGQKTKSIIGHVNLMR